MCSPRPVPPWSRRVVKNGSKARRRTSSDMPQPLSEKMISTLSLPDSRTWMSMMPVRAGIAVHGQAWLAIDVERQIVFAQARPQAHHHLLGEVAEIEAALVRIV